VVKRLTPDAAEAQRFLREARYDVSRLKAALEAARAEVAAQN
jgi:hypothetical protein